ncbi:DsbA family protein [Aliikangiella coralliicola]|uniref:DsbA family protein n=1 Tax=Aliikangiella coralliicola TaxID=2592383 RepID=A0A545U7F2_9GAMM|nr:DsbA family protein [Aliikangiella coralliicola]TQV85399.1 DsbA family protein [Aliikangiella coralliicola]
MALFKMEKQLLESQRGISIVDNSVADVVFVTDPICSHCWAIEPAWRRLILNYEITTRYIHGGLLPGWENFGDPGNNISEPQDVVKHWNEVAKDYHQPIDASVWERDPISNSYILCKAALAVRTLAPELELTFVRRMREQVFLYAKNIAKDFELIRLAESIGIKSSAFCKLLHSAKIKKHFAQERAEMEKLGAKVFPSLIFSGDTNLELTGSQTYESLEQAILSAQTNYIRKRSLTDEQKIRSFRTWTLREATEVLQKGEFSTRKILNRNGYKPMSLANSEFWYLEEK